MLASGGFQLKKWKSNLAELCDPTDKVSSAISFDDEVGSIKILGLQWLPIKDYFTFNVNIDCDSIATKRTFLSEASRIFDPLGWLAPATIVMKILFQQLWLLKIEWDDALPKDVLIVWRRIKAELSCLELIQIPRHIGMQGTNIEIHGFCDASESAYAAAIYCRSQDDTGNIEVRLITAKTKVAPVRTVSLPRLELCGAHLLTKLISQLNLIDIYQPLRYYAWTDSSVVLAWLSTHPSKWKAFIANRTAEILAVISREQWNQVPSKENPADCATRGLSPADLVKFDLWWYGPKWMKFRHEAWPKTDSKQDNLLVCKEAKPSKTVVFQQVNVISIFGSLINKISSWSKVRRVVAFCQRFINNCKANKDKTFNKRQGVLNIDEIQEAENKLLAWAQKEIFEEQINALLKGKALSSKETLASLAPFIDSSGIMRVGGRLYNATLSYNAKHPIILHASHNLSKVIGNYYHSKFLHPGPSLLFNLIRQQFWILGARNMARQIVHKCLICFRQTAKTSTQLMGNLPPSRVTALRAFHRVGVDFAGPITLATKRGRGAKHVKGYISVFVCLATKAIHLEVVSDLTTDSFIAALKRFISRRGSPLEIMSDNATNFVGAKNKLTGLYKNLPNNFNELVSEFVCESNIKWSFIPPAAPNFGGIWESAVKSMKTHLIKATGNTFLTFEEMATLTTQIEAILNSRPLCPINNEDVSNLDALTPGHFLIMAPLTAIPEPGLDHLSINRLGRWQLVQQRSNSFWKRYSKEYLHTLHQRTKWKSQSPNLSKDDLVLVKEDNLPPCNWALGRISEVKTGSDGLVRVVVVRTAKSSFIRPISKICKLPNC